MRQGRIHWLPCVAMALGIAAGSFSAPATRVAGAAGSEAKSVRAPNGLHQFTGVVTALDKTTLTVEKRGKKPRTVVFTRHAEMKSSGEVEKNARVTVYYRDEGGHSIAHRVVVKTDRPRGTGSSN
jgi:hypothetical protein